MVTVTHVITGLGSGGAEHSLLRLISTVDTSRVSSKVISLTDLGPVASAIVARGVPVQALGLSHPLQLPGAVARLARMLRRDKPDVVQTWMYHADLIGGLAGRLAGVPDVVWGIRASNLTDDIKRRTRAAARVEAALSGFLPSRIVSCAHVARDVHVAIGFRADRIVVIPNGFDLPTLGRTRSAALRQRLHIPDGALVVGRAGRYHAQKDYPTFVAAAIRVAHRCADVHFLLCGEQVTGENEHLSRLVGDSGVKERFHLLGPLGDMASFYSTIDITCSSSAFGEGFPNVIAEAMSFGVPAVTTDVGDSAAVVGDTGIVVSPSDPIALSDALAELLSLPRGELRALGRRARTRIADEFTVEAMARRYTDLYEELATSVRN